jgi:hypothetical protein
VVYSEDYRQQLADVQAQIATATDQAKAEPAQARKSTSTPAGKVKASFNLLPEDLDLLRALARRHGTTVTNVLERAIRDEQFIQDQLAGGNRFAIVDREGTVREIIWR